MSLLWTEYLRASADVAGYVATLPDVHEGPRGDGHAVLVLPGLMADDGSTAPLRHVLRLRGYDARGWRLGPNLGPTRRITSGVMRCLDEAWERSGAPVSLVGWSLGGILAREVARLRPDRVRGVITLGSPFRLTVEDPPGTSHAGWLFHSLRPWHDDLLDGDDRDAILPVPATAIYSKLDGIVPWQACVSPEGEQQESVEVSASHTGMGAHPQVLQIVLDRLARWSGDPVTSRPAAA